MPFPEIVPSVGSTAGPSRTNIAWQSTPPFARSVRFACTAATLLLAASMAAAQAQTADEPIVNPHPSVELKKFVRPDIPSDKLTAPLLPPKSGCFHLVDNVWTEVPCATPDYMNKHYIPPPVVANSIQSTPHFAPFWVLGKPQPEITSPLDWGAVVIELGGDPAQATETDVSTNPKTGAVTKTSNAFSIQVNTNDFTCSTCKNGSPFAAVSGVPNSASAPGDTGWVQFVYQQFASGTDGSSRLCVWNVDTTVAANTTNNAGYKPNCVYPSASYPMGPLTGNGAVIGAAEVIGYTQCPSPISNAGCTLWAVAKLPFAAGAGWWAISAKDEMGLTGNWTNVGGTVYGAGGGSRAVFTNTQVQTNVVAYSCYTAPAGPTGYTPQGCAPPPPYDFFAQFFYLKASPADYFPTGESNNLTNDPVTFSCGDYDCWLNYNSTHN